MRERSLKMVHTNFGIDEACMIKQYRKSNLNKNLDKIKIEKKKKKVKERKKKKRRSLIRPLIWVQFRHVYAVMSYNILFFAKT